MKMTPLVVLPLVLGLSACSLIDKKPDKNTTDAQDVQAIQALNKDFVSGTASTAADFGFSVPSVSGTSRATTNNPAAAYASLARTQGAVLREQDRLDVTVFKVPELSAVDLSVETNGAISLPLLGSVVVGGLTIDQAQQKIAGLLSKNYLQDPKVTVTRKEQAFKRVTVEGAVTSPGVFPITGRMTFLQAIALSQGLTDLANEKAVIVFRNGRQYGVNLDLIRRGKAPDPILQNDDRIVVLKSDNKVLEEKVINYLPALLSPFSLLQ
ncbi:polysaccharide export protein [Leucothrix sargassi]|nr:polysaccharide export protein [Leucothrix sargassi]